MCDPEDLDPEVRKALDERITWINQVTDLCLEHGPDAIRKHIDEIDDAHVRSVIFVLILARAGDKRRALDLVREQAREDMLRALREAERPSEAEIERLREYIVSLEEYIQAMQRPSQN